MKSIFLFCLMLIMGSTFLIPKQTAINGPKIVILEKTIFPVQSETTSMKREAKKLLNEFLKTQIVILETNNQTKSNILQIKQTQNDFRKSTKYNAYRN